MKKLLLIIFSLCMLLSCDDIDVAPDNCDRTIASEINADIEVNVFVKTDWPMSTMDITVTCSKKPCGGEIKGVYTNSKTVNHVEGDNQYFMAQLTGWNYSLRNGMDMIIVEVHAVDDYEEGVSKSVTLSYEDIKPDDGGYHSVNVDLDF